MDSKIIKLTALITSLLLWLTILFAFVPMFSVYNVGGEITSEVVSSPLYEEDNIDGEITSEIVLSSSPEEDAFQDGNDITHIVDYKELPVRKQEFKVKGSLVLKEGSQELNPYTRSGLFTPFQLLVRIAKDKNKEAPYKIQSIELF